MHAYLDQELDLPGVVAIDQHLAACPACKQFFARHAALQSAVRQHATYYTAPSALADRVRATVGAAAAASPARTPEPAGARLPFGRWLPLGAAVAAAAVVSWTAAIQYAALGGDDALAEQVIASHARAVLTTHLADVASSDQHTVKPWLSSRLDFSPPVTDLARQGFPLTGGRLDYLDSRPVAALVFGHRQHVIDLFVWPDPKASRAGGLRSQQKNGYTVVHWTEGGMAFWAISDLNPAEMKSFAEIYASAK
jgi:anti-sigma factor RsiW